MVKNHLKRINAPKTWPITRKATTYTLRPNPGGHTMDKSMPLSLILRDEIKIAGTMRSIKTLLNTQDVLVNGKRRRRPEDTAGLMDVITIPALKTSYRIIITTRNKLKAIPIAGDEAKLVPSKVTSKTALTGGKLQLGCHNGRTVIVDKSDYKVGGTVMLGFDNTIKNHYPLATGAPVLVTSGKHVGKQGSIKEVNNGTAIVKAGEETFDTNKEFLFVLGKDKPAVKTE